MTATKTPKATAPKTTKPEPIVAVGALDIPLPAKPSRAIGKVKYPFDSLEPNTCFSVLNKNRREMTGPIASANKRYKSELKNAEGQVTVVQTREFYAVDVDAELAKSLVGTPHEGATVLVIRSK